MGVKQIAQNVQINSHSVDIGQWEYKTPYYGYTIRVIVFAATFDVSIDKNLVSAFSDAAISFIETNHPANEGVLTACICVFSGFDITPSAIKFSKKSFHGNKGYRPIPVLYNTSSGLYHTFNRFNIWGFMHANYYLRTIREVISHLKNNNFKLF